MRVTLIGPVFPFRGGISHYHMLFAKALIQAGFEIQIISFKRQYPHWLYPGKSDRDPSQTALQVDAKFTLDPINPWTWWQSYNQIKPFSPDLVIFQWWTTFWAPAYLILTELLRSKRFPIAFLIHNVLPHENKIFDKLLARMVLSRGDFFVLLTKREQIRLFNLFKAKNSFVCKYPANTMLNNQRIGKTEARIKLNLPIEKFIRDKVRADYQVQIQSPVAIEIATGLFALPSADELPWRAATTSLIVNIRQDAQLTFVQLNFTH